MNVKMEFGVIGLGRMGGDLSLQAMEKGITVAGYDAYHTPDELIAAGLRECTSLDDFRAQLAPPRAVFLYIPAGPAVDTVLDKLAALLEEGDVIVDGGNSYWGDSIERGKRLHARGLHFVDLGTSGGVSGARHGACFMAGGADQAIARIEPILRKLAVPGGYLHTGPVGTGHFTKLVHNGIEFGMLQAIGEGVNLLSNFHEKLDIAEILYCWEHGSVIRSWLVELMEKEYRDHDGLDSVPPYIEDTGEVNWLIADAIEMEVPIPAITTSIMELFASRDESRKWARAIAMMRNGFGGHVFGPDQPTADERRHGRVGCTWRRKAG